MRFLTSSGVVALAAIIIIINITFSIGKASSSPISSLLGGANLLNASTSTGADVSSWTPVTSHQMAAQTFSWTGVSSAYTPTGGATLCFTGGPTSGITSVTESEQTIDLFSSPYYATASDSADFRALLANGSLALKLSAWLGGYADHNDIPTINATFFSSSSSSSVMTMMMCWIGPLTPTDRDDGTKFLFHSRRCIVPPQTQRIVVSIIQQKLTASGSSNDGYVSDVAAVFEKSSSSSSSLLFDNFSSTSLSEFFNTPNLLQNGDAEQSTTTEPLDCWPASNGLGLTVGQYSSVPWGVAELPPAPDRGMSFFIATARADCETTVSEQVGVLPSSSTAGGGVVSAVMSAWVGKEAQKTVAETATTPKLRLTFLDAVGNIVAPVVVAEPDSSAWNSVAAAADGGFVFFTKQTPVPPETSYFRLEIVMNTFSTAAGSSNVFALFDSVRLNFTTTATFTTTTTTTTTTAAASTSAAPATTTTTTASSSPSSASGTTTTQSGGATATSTTNGASGGTTTTSSTTTTTTVAPTTTTTTTTATTTTPSTTSTTTEMPSSLVDLCLCNKTLFQQQRPTLPNLVRNGNAEQGSSPSSPTSALTILAGSPKILPFASSGISDLPFQQSGRAGSYFFGVDPSSSSSSSSPSQFALSGDVPNCFARPNDRDGFRYGVLSAYFGGTGSSSSTRASIQISFNSNSDASSSSSSSPFFGSQLYERTLTGGTAAERKNKLAFLYKDLMLSVPAEAVNFTLVVSLSGDKNAFIDDIQFHVNCPENEESGELLFPAIVENATHLGPNYLLNGGAEWVTSFWQEEEPSSSSSSSFSTWRYKFAGPEQAPKGDQNPVPPWHWPTFLDPGPHPKLRGEYFFRGTEWGQTTTKKLIQRTSTCDLAKSIDQGDQRGVFVAYAGIFPQSDSQTTFRLSVQFFDETGSLLHPSPASVSTGWVYARDMELYASGLYLHQLGFTFPHGTRSVAAVIEMHYNTIEIWVDQVGVYPYLQSCSTQSCTAITNNNNIKKASSSSSSSSSSSDQFSIFEQNKCGAPFPPTTTSNTVAASGGNVSGSSGFVTPPPPEWSTVEPTAPRETLPESAHVYKFGPIPPAAAAESNTNTNSNNNVTVLPAIKNTETFASMLHRADCAAFGRRTSSTVLATCNNMFIQVVTDISRIYPLMYLVRQKYAPDGSPETDEHLMALTYYDLRQSDWRFYIDWITGSWGFLKATRRDTVEFSPDCSEILYTRSWIKRVSSSGVQINIERSQVIAMNVQDYTFRTWWPVPPHRSLYKDWDNVRYLRTTPISNTHSLFTVFFFRIDQIPLVRVVVNTTTFTETSTLPSWRTDRAKLNHFSMVYGSTVPTLHIHIHNGSIVTTDLQVYWVHWRYSAVISEVFVIRWKKTSAENDDDDDDDVDAANGQVGNTTTPMQFDFTLPSDFPNPWVYIPGGENNKNKRKGGSTFTLLTVAQQTNATRIFEFSNPNHYCLVNAQDRVSRCTQTTRCKPYDIARIQNSSRVALAQKCQGFAGNAPSYTAFVQPDTIDVVQPDLDYVNPRSSAFAVSASTPSDIVAEKLLVPVRDAFRLNCGYMKLWQVMRHNSVVYTFPDVPPIFHVSVYRTSIQLTGRIVFRGAISGSGSGGSSSSRSSTTTTTTVQANVGYSGTIEIFETTINESFAITAAKSSHVFITSTNGQQIAKNSFTPGLPSWFSLDASGSFSMTPPTSATQSTMRLCITTSVSFLDCIEFEFFIEGSLQIDAVSSSSSSSQQQGGEGRGITIDSPANLIYVKISVPCGSFLALSAKSTIVSIVGTTMDAFGPRDQLNEMLKKVRYLPPKNDSSMTSSSSSSSSSTASSSSCAAAVGTESNATQNATVTADDFLNTPRTVHVSLSVFARDRAPTINSSVLVALFNQRAGGFPAGKNFAIDIPTQVFQDPDGDVVSNRVSVVSLLPSWCAFDSSQLRLYGNPTAVPPAPVDVTFRVDDSYLAATASVSLNVTNEPPRLTRTEVPTAIDWLADTPNSFALPSTAFISPSNNTLAYSLENIKAGTDLPSWIILDPGTGSLSGKPSAEDLGDIDVRLCAHDNYGGKTCATTKIVVNRTPYLWFLYLIEIIGIATGALASIAGYYAYRWELTNLWRGKGYCIKDPFLTSDEFALPFEFGEVTTAAAFVPDFENKRYNWLRTKSEYLWGRVALGTLPNDENLPHWLSYVPKSEKLVCDLSAIISAAGGSGGGGGDDDDDNKPFSKKKEQQSLYSSPGEDSLFTVVIQIKDDNGVIRMQWDHDPLEVLRARRGEKQRGEEEEEEEQEEGHTKKAKTANKKPLVTATTKKSTGIRIDSNNFDEHDVELATMSPSAEVAFSPTSSGVDHHRNNNNNNNNNLSGSAHHHDGDELEEGLLASTSRRVNVVLDDDDDHIHGQRQSTTKNTRDPPMRQDVVDKNKKKPTTGKKNTVDQGDFLL